LGGKFGVSLRDLVAVAEQFCHERNYRSSGVKSVAAASI
jgi:hypothetical protein